MADINSTDHPSFTHVWFSLFLA